MKKTQSNTDKRSLPNCAKVSIITIYRESRYFIKKTLLYVDTICHLGFWNVAYVAWYRFTLRTGIRKLFFPQRSLSPDSHFFNESCNLIDFPDPWKTALLKDADKIVQGYMRYYAYHWKFVGNPPNWFLNPFNGRIWENPHKHWTTLDDINNSAGDIKNIWEPSRFAWVVTLARAYAVSGKAIYLETLNRWLSDWVEKNPINIGPNWKCGQEAAIRILNLLQAASIMDQWDKPTMVLQELIYQHLERISSNIGYAIAQDNNHGTSEAAALFIGGHWCAKNYPRYSTQRDSRHYTFRVVCHKNRKEKKIRRKRCNDFANQGRKWLENRIRKLVEEDGSFPQHSTTYHRVFLDTLIFVVNWQRKLSVAHFSSIFYQRSKAALDWLITLTDTSTGKAPNLGSNDGAMLLHIHSCDYRDFRPTIQTASVLFNGYKVYPPGPWDEPCYWLGLNETVVEDVNTRKISKVLSGGYVVMVGKDSWGMVRFPMYRFRPAHNDVFHFDLWFKGKNICRDDGSYSYNPENAADGDYFGSVKAHNTVGFDNGEQMPKLGRFLMGHWIKAEDIGPIKLGCDGWQCWRGVYQDWRGNRHERKIYWKEDKWIIEDDLSGDFERAEITFRLVPGRYQIKSNTVSASWGTIVVSGSDFRIKMIDGFESLYYQQKQRVDVLVICPIKECDKIKTNFILGLQEMS